MLKSIYKYELKKLFLAKTNLLAMIGSVIILVLLAISSVSENQEVTREEAKVLDGRMIDGQLFKEIEPGLRKDNGRMILQLTEGYEKYAPVLNMIMPLTGDDFDFSRLEGTGFYDLRRQKLYQRFEKQGLEEEEIAYWEKQDAKVLKPFVYHYHSGPSNLLKSFQALGFFILLLSAVGLSGVYARETADNMNQLLLCSRFGKRELYLIKFAAGITWILTAAVLLILTLLIPYYIFFGMDGMGEMLQLVKPLSMLPCSIGHMISVCSLIFLLAAVLFAAVTMLLSVITQNTLVVTGGLLGYLIVDLFAAVPDRFRLLDVIWSLRPNAILMNTGFVNYRLMHFWGGFFMNYQAAPIIYALVIIAALFVGRWKYRRLQVGK